jgi:hypothetical protein
MDVDERSFNRPSDGEEMGIKKRNEKKERDKKWK